MDKSLVAKIKFAFYNRIMKDVDPQDEDFPIILDTLKNIESLTQQEFMDRIDLINNHWDMVKYRLMKLRVLITPALYQEYLRSSK